MTFNLQVMNIKMHLREQKQGGYPLHWSCLHLRPPGSTSTIFFDNNGVLLCHLWHVLILCISFCAAIPPRQCEMFALADQINAPSIPVGASGL